MSCVTLCKLLNLSEFPFPHFKQRGCFTGWGGTSLEPHSGRDEMPAPSAGQAQRPLGVSGTADATPPAGPCPLGQSDPGHGPQPPESPGRGRVQPRAPRGLSLLFPPRRPSPGSSALEGLEGPSSAAVLFVVPVVLRNRREILSPVRAAGGRHLKRQWFGQQ